MTKPIKVLATLAFLFVGCTGPASEGEWHGVVRRACGPTDGVSKDSSLIVGAFKARTPKGESVSGTVLMKAGPDRSFPGLCG